VVFVGWPVALEIVEEGGPIWLELMDLEIAQRKRETMVDADPHWSILSQPLDQPFGEPKRPVPTSAYTYSDACVATAGNFH
jgi:hypothetical protein